MSTLSVPSQYADIQTAILAAQEGDTVAIAPGTYTGPNNRNLYSLVAVLTITGADPATTILDGEQQGYGFFFWNRNQTIIENLTITNCLGTKGGGFYNMSGAPKFKNCNITGNSANTGGGGFEYIGLGAQATLENCTVKNNTATTGDGGGICSISVGDASANGVDSLKINNCTVTGNSALNGNGGGLFLESAGQIGSINVVGGAVAGNSAKVGNDIAEEAFTNGVIDVSGTTTGTGANDVVTIFKMGAAVITRE